KGNIMKNILRFFRGVSFATIAFLLITIIAVESHSQSKNEKELTDATRQSQKASDVFTEIMNVPDKAIPQNLLDKAEAIAVFPGVIKAGFIIGGRGDRDVITPRTVRTWNVPAFF